jgi:hypothetical protein
MNFSYQMQQFNTNIIYFGDLDQCEWYISLSIAGILRSLSLSSSTRNKKYNKNNFLYQNKTETILRDRNYITCMIV